MQTSVDHSATNRDWLRTDERLDVLESLTHLVDCLATTEVRPLAWKWVIITVHIALQGALVCVLSGSDGLGCLTKGSARKVRDFLEDRASTGVRKFPDERLADPPELLKRMQDQNYMAEFGGKPLLPSVDVLQDLDKLFEFRKQFSHFRPRGWSIQRAGLPRIVMSALSIVRELLQGHPSATYRWSSEERSALDSTLDAADAVLARLANSVS